MESEHTAENGVGVVEALAEVERLLRLDLPRGLIHRGVIRDRIAQVRAAFTDPDVALPPGEPTPRVQAEDDYDPNECGNCGRCGFCDAPPVQAEAVAACAKDDHDAVWQAGREAGYRDALIALADHSGQFLDDLDRAIADALRKDQQYVAAHDAAVLRSAATLLDLEAEENYTGGADVDAGTYQAAARIVRAEAEHIAALVPTDVAEPPC